MSVPGLTIEPAGHSNPVELNVHEADPIRKKTTSGKGQPTRKENKKTGAIQPVVPPSGLHSSTSPSVESTSHVCLNVGFPIVRVGRGPVAPFRLCQTTARAHGANHAPPVASFPPSHTPRRLHPRPTLCFLIFTAGSRKKPRRSTPEKNEISTRRGLFVEYYRGAKKKRSQEGSLKTTRHKPR